MGAAAKPIIFFSNGMFVPVALASAVAPRESGAQKPTTLYDAVGRRGAAGGGEKG